MLHPLVAPTHSNERMLGTNPIAVAIPTDKQPPFVADMATTTAANGKLEVLQGGDVLQDSQVFSMVGRVHFALLDTVWLFVVRVLALLLCASRSVPETVYHVLAVSKAKALTLSPTEHRAGSFRAFEFSCVKKSRAAVVICRFASKIRM